MKCNSRKWAKGRGNCDVKKWLFPVQHSYPYLRPTHKQEERWDGGLRGWKRQRGKWERGRMIKEDWSGEKMMVRKFQKGEETRGIEWISLISCSFTHSQTSFPFPPIISSSSYPVLGRGGGIFFCAVQWCHSLLYREQKAPPPRTPTPNPSPTIRDPSSYIPELRHVFWFIKICGALTSQTWSSVILTLLQFKYTIHCHWFSVVKAAYFH